MKKFVATLTACACLGLSTISASAASTDIQEGPGVNLDPIMEAYKAKGPIEGPVTLFDSNSLARAWSSAGGGQFRVVWGLDNHTSEYKHNSKVHRSSASNSNATERSSWESPGDLASVWIYSTLSGNKANWATK
ncbi:lactococcin 972 family bacteriocin [Bacillus mycoides]|uniref:lactococcin 972 family bacteriocin n=1 Tax=Bacillus mycoides TaxID=1405 RepID=UPI001F145C9F|nr:lactococcin 972 family bacteriocin [Bacillus mycoides]